MMLHKFYDYSVKRLLIDYFGENTVFSMRRPHESVYRSKEAQEHFLPLVWQYADEQATGLFMDSSFLIETALEDDYIAYIGRLGEKKFVYLMFMVTEDEPLFHIDVNYAKELIVEWNAKGFETLILRECVGVIYYGIDKTNGFHLGTHSYPGRGAALYELTCVNGTDLLTFSNDPCWDFYFKKLVCVSGRSDIREYECLFAPDVVITAGEEKTKRTLCTGIGETRAFFGSSPSVYIGYQEFEGSGVYSRGVFAGDRELTLTVNRCNLISEISISDARPFGMIREDPDHSYGSLLDSIPEIRGVRALDPEKMHGYAVQLEYAEDDIRNYYLHTFGSRDMPETCSIQGYSFSAKVFRSAKIGEKGALYFENGFTIPRHILYYRSYRQVQIKHTGDILYQKDGAALRSVYKLPLIQTTDFFSVGQYRGRPDECFGPKRAWLDERGNRKSDIALYSIKTGEKNISAAVVCVEPTAKYGYLNDDGTWLAPPVYDEAEAFSEGCAKAARTENGEKRYYLLAEDGTEKPFDHQIGMGSFTNGRCAFNAKKWEGARPDTGYYWDVHDVEPGSWGFVDQNGNVVVEPRYVFAAGFYNGGGEHSVVARYVGGKLCWGVIDLNGVEVIPCIYPSLYCRFDEAVAFQSEEDGAFGLMDFDGHILADPQFGYIEQYDAKHRLITAGADGDDLGVYSIELGRMIIPPEFDCVDYGEHMVSCEVRFTCKDRYFDYHGTELDLSQYESVYESNGYLIIQKDGKCGVLGWDGTLIIPPVLVSGMECHIDHYKMGYLITEDKGLRGLSRVSGEVILPAVFSDVSFHGGFVTASVRTPSNRCVNETLYTLNGEAVLSGLFRHMCINEDRKGMSVETPTGLVFIEIEGSMQTEAENGTDGLLSCAAGKDLK